MSSAELITWGIGIIVTIILGVFVVKRVRRQSQVQKTGPNSKNIQSGRDTKIG